jgi:FkbM family methyltransferase
MGRFLKSKIFKGDLDSNPLVIVDVGINRGQSTILFLKWFPKVRIHGFEPLRHLFAFTEIRLANRARLYNLGACSNSGVQRS